MTETFEQRFVEKFLARLSALTSSSGVSLESIDEKTVGRLNAVFPDWVHLLVSSKASVHQWAATANTEKEKELGPPPLFFSPNGVHGVASQLLLPHLCLTPSPLSPEEEPQWSQLVSSFPFEAVERLTGHHAGGKGTVPPSRSPLVETMRQLSAAAPVHLWCSGIIAVYAASILSISTDSLEYWSDSQLLDNFLTLFTECVRKAERHTVELFTRCLQPIAVDIYRSLLSVAAVSLFDSARHHSASFLSEGTVESALLIRGMEMYVQRLTKQSTRCVSACNDLGAQPVPARQPSPTAVHIGLLAGVALQRPLTGPVGGVEIASPSHRRRRQLEIDESEDETGTEELNTAENLFCPQQTPIAAMLLSVFSLPQEGHNCGCLAFTEVQLRTGNVQWHALHSHTMPDTDGLI